LIYPVLLRHRYFELLATIGLNTLSASPMSPSGLASRGLTLFDVRRATFLITDKS
jgi:hypothetical protein